MRFSPSGLSFVAPSSIHRAVTAAIVLPATLVAASAFAQVPPPDVTARSWVLVDATSNQVLASGNPDERSEPASLTKLMTAYLVFDALKSKKINMDQTVMPSEAVRRVGTDESRMFIEANKPVTVHDLVYGMIIQSGNDAAIALAELVGGSESNFVALMNAAAKQIGMKNTHFADVNGMPDPQHYTTAGDLAVLSARLIRDFPEYYPLYSIKEYRYNNITQSNRNRLLWSDPYVDGVKTGFTDGAGYCLIGSAKRGPRRLLAVVLGAASDAARASEAQKLLNYGFQFYDTVQLYQNGAQVSALKVWKGTTDSVPAGFVVDQYVTLPKGQAPQLKLTMEAVEPLVAPIARGQRVGLVKVTLDAKPVGEYPLVALEEVPLAGLFGRAWDTIRLWFK